jgi:hypothetical protein
MISFLSRRRQDIIICLLVAACIYLAGLLLGAWNGFLKGDDAYYHVARVQYILDNFPHLSWYRQSFNGYDPFGFEAPFIYFVIAFAQKLTGLTIETLFQVMLLLSMTAFGVSFYCLARFLRVPRPAAFAFSLLPFTIPEVWNWLVIGGAYLRIPALSVFVFCIIVSFIHIEKINRAEDRISSYMLAIAALALLAMIHPLIWQWGFLITASVYLLGIRGWRRKISSLIKVFVPVSLLAAWMYIPLLSRYVDVFRLPSEVKPIQYTVPLSFRWLVDIPSYRSFSNSLGPVVLPLALLFLGWAVSLRVWKTGCSSSRLKLVFAAVIGIFAIYFFSFGWLPLPAGWYLMATFDYCLFFGLALAVWAVFMCSVLIENGAFLRSRVRLVADAQMALIIIVVCGNLAVFPFLKTYTYVRTPWDPTTPAYAEYAMLKKAVDSGTGGYRLENNQRIIQAWLGLDASMLTTGGRSGNDAPHEYYTQWADSVVSYGLNINDLAGVYYEDTPLILRTPLGGEENYYAAMFWLDWFGAAGPVLSPEWYPQGNTTLGYAGRPQFFQQFTVKSQFGDLYFYKSLGSSPIAVSTGAEAIAVPYQSGDAPPFYVDFLDLLSSINLNSQQVIPVKLDSDAGLNDFQSALVGYDEYLSNRDRLDAYVAGGGHLIVAGPITGSESKLEAQLPGTGIHLEVQSSLLSPPADSAILAESSEGTLAYRASRGEGSITMLGMPLENLLNCDSTAGALLLAEAVAPDLDLSSLTANMADSYISYSTGGGTYSISDTGDPSLNFSVNPNLASNQFNWTFPLTKPLEVNTETLVQFSLWSDGNAANSVGIALEQAGKYAYLGYTIPDQAWSGWKDFTVPLSSFEWKTGDVAEHANYLTFCFTQNAPYTEATSSAEFKLKDVNIITVNQSGKYGVLNGTWETANEYKSDVAGGQPILWKESYLPTWKITDDLGRPVNYYFAGPGMIYLVPAPDARYIVFEMPLPETRVVGIIVSTVSFVGLVLFWALLSFIKGRKRRLPAPP